MVLSPQEGRTFFKLYPALLWFVNQRLGVLPGQFVRPEDFAGMPPEDLVKIRDALASDVDLIESFVDHPSASLSDDELEIALSWRNLVHGEFYLFRYLKKHTVLLSTDKELLAYGVVAPTHPIADLIGPHLPILTKTVLLPFKDRIVYDGLLNSYNVSFGPGIRRSLNEDYQEAKQRYGIITTLPFSGERQDREIARRQPKTVSRAKSATPRYDVKEVLHHVIGLTDQFCRDHLNDEYAELCRRLAEKLARKRPSPLVSGTPNVWACGIVRTIGWVNFLDDRKQTPHLKLTEIDKAFAVGQSTGQGKSKQIRDMLRISPFGHEWTLPRRLEDNLLIWMLNVNGFPMDIRGCPREAQEAAYEKGLIPYVPADRESGAGRAK